MFVIVLIGIIDQNGDEFLCIFDMKVFFIVIIDDDLLFLENDYNVQCLGNMLLILLIIIKKVLQVGLINEIQYQQVMMILLKEVIVQVFNLIGQVGLVIIVIDQFKWNGFNVMVLDDYLSLLLVIIVFFLFGNEQVVVIVVVVFGQLKIEWVIGIG